MSKIPRLLWKAVGGGIPFTGAVLTAYYHPHYTIPILGLAIMWANTLGFIEGHKRSIKP